MNNANKSALIFLALFVSMALALYCGCNKLTNDICRNDVLRTVLSPDGKVKVIIFERDCGATTGFSTQISVQSANAKLPNAIGNTFVVEGSDQAGSSGGPQIQVVWQDNGRLLIRHNPKARVSSAKKQIRVDLEGAQSRAITVLYAP